MCREKHGSSSSQFSTSKPAPVDVIVVGNGPVGSASAAALARSGLLVEIIDGCLPSSHADFGRICRELDAEADLQWNKWNRQSLEYATERGFFRSCGAAVVGSASMIDALGAQPRELSHRLTGAKLRLRLPMVGISEGSEALVSRRCGYVDPLAMIAHFNRGIAVRKATVIRVEDAEEGLPEVVLEGGGRLRAKHIVVAAGAFSDAILPLTCRVHYRISARTVLLAEVSEAALGSLEGMPTLKFELPQETPTRGVQLSHSAHSAMEAKSVYVLPPIRYPDGRLYIKIGGGPNKWLGGGGGGGRLSALRQRLRALEADPELVQWLARALRQVLPDFKPVGLVARSCFTTCTKEGAFVTRTRGAITAACGGQGKAAGPAFAIGEHVAKVVRQQMYGNNARL